MALGALSRRQCWICKLELATTLSLDRHAAVLAVASREEERQQLLAGHLAEHLELALVRARGFGTSVLACSGNGRLAGMVWRGRRTSKGIAML